MKLAKTIVDLYKKIDRLIAVADKQSKLVEEKNSEIFDLKSRIGKMNQERPSGIFAHESVINSLMGYCRKNKIGLPGDKLDNAIIKELERLKSAQPKCAGCKEPLHYIENADHWGCVNPDCDVPPDQPKKAEKASSSKNIQYQFCDSLMSRILDISGEKLEMFAAAFLKETGLPASKVEIVIVDSFLDVGKNVYFREIKR